MKTLNPILKTQFRLTSDGDSWGNAMQWLFAIGDYITFKTDSHVPNAWDFRPSPLGANEDCYVFQFLCDENIPADSVLEFGNALLRVRDILISQGRDY